jgi:hypothetical protein
MKQDYQDTPIFITGIERSGSSIVAKIISMCGAYSGKTNEMQENLNIKSLLDWYYTEKLGIPESGQFPLPKTRDLPSVSDLKVSILSLLDKEGYNRSKPWLLKGFRLAQTWPIWDKAFPNAKWIIVRRRTGDIIQSCMKTGHMKAYDNQVGWLGWVHDHEKYFVEILEKGLNCKIVWPERMATEDFTQMQETIEWLNLSWISEIEKLILPLFNNSPQKERSK